MRGPFPAAPELRTLRLVLRPLRPEDAAGVFAYASQPGFFRFLDQVPERVRAAYLPADAEAHLRDLLELAAQGWPNWGIHLDGRLVGAIRLRPGPDGPELGYGLAAAAQGQGLATEAGRAALAWADLHAARTWARTHPAHHASRSVLRKLGFVPAGTDPEGRALLVRDRPPA